MNINLIRNNINKHYKEKTEAHYEATKRHNKKWNKYYQDHRWKRLREWKMSHDAVCENCLYYGRVVPACECHHIIPFGSAQTEEEKFRLLLDPLNLVSLCSDCHDVYHEHLKRGDSVEHPLPKWMALMDI